MSSVVVIINSTNLGDFMRACVLLPIRVTIGALTVLGMFVAPLALAQVRPAYMKNVDEPGRQPYNFSVQFNVANCVANCSNFVFQNNEIVMDAPAVPAGKRLVVKWVSGQLPAIDGLNYVYIAKYNYDPMWSFGGPFYTRGLVGGAALQSFSSGAFFTVGPLEAPHLVVRLGSYSSVNGSVAISGYLIDATN
ncbi:hypothetical protein [Rhodoferax sp.]|uniref:hypothetical protein n=1 Tax=Rhodoferax sp. TaxID=50421 RepID=UPI002852C55B|nr:hypothetical protein [Rhodoferax sp.]